MLALTLHQPWASAIATLGKDIENRTWAPTRSVVGQRIAIHAATRVRYEEEERVVLGGLPPHVREEMRELAEWRDAPPRWALCYLQTLPRGAIVATARVARIVRADTLDPVLSSPWWQGPVGWVLDEVQAMACPIVCRGAQGLWTVPPHVEASIARGGRL